MTKKQLPDNHVAISTTPVVSLVTPQVPSLSAAVNPPQVALITDMKPVSRTSHPLTRAVSNQQVDRRRLASRPQPRAAAHFVSPRRSLDGIIMPKQA